ncbi:hypothetical protein [Effusibacillus consociatus]|uniref:YycE-like N-terminal domain-containing protein n=1 Tax=Effusibacillus consociatus TaxID=1117041 RepID=A0ABV9Q2W6_9BACL
MKYEWSKSMPVVQVRIARPTDQLAKVAEFYKEVLYARPLNLWYNMVESYF